MRQSSRELSALKAPQERPMYHSTSSPRTSRSPCEELSGPKRRSSEIGSLHKYTKSHGRLANANKAAAPRTGARGSGADAQKLHHARRVAAAERRASVPAESRAARGGAGSGVGAGHLRPNA